MRMTVMCLEEFLEHKCVQSVLAAIIIVVNIIHFDKDL